MLLRALWTWGHTLADFVFVASCAGCGGREQPLVTGLCPCCTALLAGPAWTTRPDPCPPGLPPVWTVAAYAGPVRAALVRYKERDRRELREPLATALARGITASAAAGDVSAAGGGSAVCSGPRGGVTEAWPEARPREGGPCLLVPVPSTPATIRARGRDTLAVLARRAAELADPRGRSYQVVPALCHTRTVRDSAGLDAGARARNLAQALTVAPAQAAVLRGYRVLILDDLVTTGATLAEASRALRAAGGTVTGAVVVAATRRRSGDRRAQPPTVFRTGAS